MLVVLRLDAGADDQHCLSEKQRWESGEEAAHFNPGLSREEAQGRSFGLHGQALLQAVSGRTAQD